MKNDQFNDLLEKLPEIAKAVNVFSSEDIQKQAFQALISALGIPSVTLTNNDTTLSDNSVSGNGGGATKPVRKAARKTKSTSAKIPERLQDIDLQTSLDGYPDFHALKKKADKLLWVLQFAHGAGLASLRNAEIVFLSDRLGDGIPSADINGYYKSNLKKGHVNRSLQDKTMRILPLGSTYLAGLLKKVD